MGTPAKDYDLVLEAPSSVDAELAKDLLASRGITSFTQGKDRDLAELGAGIHNSLTRPNLYVEKGRGEAARAIIEEAWAKEPLEEDFPVGEPVSELPEKREGPALSRVAVVLVILLAVIAFVLLRLYLTPGTPK